MQCLSCQWVLSDNAKELLCSEKDNPSCYRRRMNPTVDINKLDKNSSEYRVAICEYCRLMPTYRDVCIIHLFSEGVDDLMERWGVTDSAVYAVRKRRRGKYRKEIKSGWRVEISVEGSSSCETREQRSAWLCNRSSSHQE